MGRMPATNLEVDLPQWVNIRGFFTLGAVEAFLENNRFYRGRPAVAAPNSAPH
jgi:hypothetical protein